MKQLKTKISKLLIVTIISLQLLTPSYVLAAPTPPTAPSAPSAPSAPAPTTPPNAPTPPSAPGNGSSNNENPQPTATPTQPQPNHSPASPTPAQTEATITPTPAQQASNTNTGANSNNDAAVGNQTDTTVETNNNADIANDLLLNGTTGGNLSDKNTGDGVVVSGDSSIGAGVENLANQTNTSVATCGATSCTSIGGGETSNSNTGSNSNNNAAVSNGSTTSITNNNTANLDTGLIAIADTGRNSASKNTGSGYVESGDANVGLTVVNVANTDITGVKTSEFNIVDDHNGDIVIDFANLSATSINGSGNNASNNQTGANSNNNAIVDNNTSLTIVNNNDAQVVSDIAVDAITGFNRADKNTGDGMVKSGDANVVTNVVNLVNNTLTSGAEILVATVNVFGDWIGDLILTDSSSNVAACGSCGNNSGAAANSNTGANSSNSSTTSSNKVTELETNNTAEIGNGILLNANTGTNFADSNTGGAQIETGEINAEASVNTVANTNTNGGTWWLVIVNDAGRWIGHVMGADEHGNLAQTGTVDLGSSNDTTGADSNNSSSVNNSEQTSITQNNNANVDTNIVINADTGHNSASKNTGEGSISTGDVNVASNIVNFVNNNFSGGKVILTFVNVFGTWIGDAITPNGVADSNNPGSNENGVGGVVETPTIVDESYAETSSSNNETQVNDSETYVSRSTQLDRLVAKKKTSKVLGSATYKPTSEISSRVASGQWLIDVDQTITVTPSPVASSSIDTNGDSSIWWRILAGLSVSMLAVVSSQFRQMAGWFPKN